MGAAKERICANCGAVEMTASRSLTCFACYTEERQLAKRQEEKDYIESLGYTDVEYVGFNCNNKPEWRFKHECGSIQTWVYGNIVKRAKEDPDRIPCSSCGGKRRAAKATAGFVAKYGITPEQLVELERYTKKVRGLTESVYKLHKQEINPLNLKRGQTEDDYHLDHKIPIRKGFDLGLPPEFIARKENLQMLTSKENLSKGRK